MLEGLPTALSGVAEDCVEFRRLLDLQGYVLLAGQGTSAQQLVKTAEMVGDVDLLIEESLSGPTVMELRHDPVRGRSASEAAYFTCDAFPQHTDMAYVECPPRYLLMQCVRQSPNQGGTTLLAHCDAARDRLSKDELAALTEPVYRFKFPPGCPECSSRSFSVVHQVDRHICFRFKRSAMSFPPSARGPVEAFDEALTANVLAHLLLPGEILVIDNHRVTHGRTSFVDTAGSRRHLRRTYARERENGS